MVGLIVSQVEVSQVNRTFFVVLVWLTEFGLTEIMVSTPGFMDNELDERGDVIMVSYEVIHFLSIYAYAFHNELQLTV